MSNAPRILAFSGSARQDSFNQRLVKIAAEGAIAAGADVTVVNLRDYPLPLFDEDTEAREGLPAQVVRWKELLLDHDGLLISCPEYNSSITPLLKNAIDWASRPRPGEPRLGCFVGKVAALLSASPGSLGGLRGLVHVRSILSNIQVLVLPDQLAVPLAHEAFLADGTLKDPKQQSAALAVGDRLARLLDRLLE